jgi:hypothetical protein
MSLKSSFRSALALMAVFTLYSPHIARADQFDKKIVVSFNKPIEIPDLVLEPGTYVFRLARHGDIPNLVEVFNEEETRLYASRFTVAKFRDTVTDEPFFQFEERNAGQPMAIDAWFYPGEDTGYEFVYSKDSNVQSAAGPAVDVTPDNTAAIAPSSEPTVDPPQNDTTETVQIIVFVVAPEVPAPDPSPAFAIFTVPSEPVAVAAPAQPNELPKTASHLPLLALLGTLSLSGAAILQAVRRLSPYFARK